VVIVVVVPFDGAAARTGPAIVVVVAYTRARATKRRLVDSISIICTVSFPISVSVSVSFTAAIAIIAIIAIVAIVAVVAWTVDTVEAMLVALVVAGLGFRAHCAGFLCSVSCRLFVVWLHSVIASASTPTTASVASSATVCHRVVDSCGVVETIRR
jgi:hypothetical protein